MFALLYQTDRPLSTHPGELAAWAASLPVGRESELPWTAGQRKWQGKMPRLGQGVKSCREPQCSPRVGPVCRETFRVTSRVPSTVLHGSIALNPTLVGQGG